MHEAKSHSSAVSVALRDWAEVSSGGGISPEGGEGWFPLCWNKGKADIDYRNPVQITEIYVR
jgi:hypothetical protein